MYNPLEGLSTLPLLQLAKLFRCFVHYEAGLGYLHRVASQATIYSRDFTVLKRKNMADNDATLLAADEQHATATAIVMKKINVSQLSTSAKDFPARPGTRAQLLGDLTASGARSSVHEIIAQ